MRSPILPVGPRSVQFQSAAERNNPFAHEDAMRRLLDRDTSEIARVLGLSRRLVGYWQERYATANRGPGRTLSLAAHAAVAHGRDVADALAPVAAIADEFGYDLVARSAPSDGGISPASALGRITAELGDVARGIGAGDDSAALRKEWRELVDAVQSFGEVIEAQEAGR